MSLTLASGAWKLTIISCCQFVLEDIGRSYDIQLSDEGEFGEPSSPLISAAPEDNKWSRIVSIGALSVLPQKVLLVGSLFSSSKVLTSHPDKAALRDAFSKSLAFRNPWLLRPANAVAARLGNVYLGMHARVGDGSFLLNAAVNMERSWRELLAVMGVDGELVETMWELVKPAEQRRRVRRKVAALAAVPESTWGWLDGNTHDDNQLTLEDRQEVSSPPARHLHKRAPIDATATEWTLRNLTCRAPLHTAPELLPFNQPLYLATDSRDPTSNQALSIFFKTFPCTFTLDDFDHPSPLNDGVVVGSVEEMGRLENDADGMPLGRLFLPFLEAVIAAKAEHITGTHGSTFSGFAAGGMHRAYHDDA